MHSERDSQQAPAGMPAQRRLRLSTVLADLQKEVESAHHDHAGDDDASAHQSHADDRDRANPPAAADPDPDPRTASGGKRKKRRRTPSDVTVGEIIDRTREAGFGFLIAFLAVCSFPAPGLSVPFGVAIVFVSIQIVFGLHRPWLPKSLRRHRVSLKTLNWIGNTLARWTSWMEYIVKPRFAFLTRGVLWSLCGLGMLILGIGLSLPLPIPFSNLFFAIPIVLYAIAILEADGLLIMLAHTLTVWQCMFIYRIWNQVVHLLHESWVYVQSFFS